jgi:hypothetical protein
VLRRKNPKPRLDWTDRMVIAVLVPAAAKAAAVVSAGKRRRRRCAGTCGWSAGGGPIPTGAAGRLSMPGLRR